MVRHESAFAAAVREARTQSGLTQDQAAERSGISRSTLIRWESGEITEPVLSQLRSFMRAVDAPADVILRALDLLPDADAPAPVSLDDIATEDLMRYLEQRMRDEREGRQQGRRRAPREVS